MTLATVADGTPVTPVSTPSGGVSATVQVLPANATAAGTFVNPLASGQQVVHVGQGTAVASGNPIAAIISAAFELSSHFLPGTQVFVYPRTLATGEVWAREAQDAVVAARETPRPFPYVDPVAQAITQDDSLTLISGLENGRYWALGLHDGVWQYIAFTVDGQP